MKKLFIAWLFCFSFCSVSVASEDSASAVNNAALPESPLNIIRPAALCSDLSSSDKLYVEFSDLLRSPKAVAQGRLVQFLMEDVNYLLTQKSLLADAIKKQEIQIQVMHHDVEETQKIIEQAQRIIEQQNAKIARLESQLAESKVTLEFLNNTVQKQQTSSTKMNKALENEQDRRVKAIGDLSDKVISNREYIEFQQQGFIDILNRHSLGLLICSLMIIVIITIISVIFIRRTNFLKRQQNQLMKEINQLRKPEIIEVKNINED